MPTAYISERVSELGGLTKIGHCRERYDTNQRFLSMLSKHDYPRIHVRKEVYVPADLLFYARYWEKETKILYKNFNRIVFRNPEIFTITANGKKINFKKEEPSPANGGTEFYSLNNKQIKDIENSLCELNEKIRLKILEMGNTK